MAGERGREMEHQWYCRVAGKEYGPISGDTLQEWVQTGRVSRDDLARRDDSEWVALRSIGGINWPAEPPVPPPVSVPKRPATRAALATQHRPHTKLGKRPTNWWALFDWRFKYFLTPWIIRILWVGFLLLTLLVVLGRTYLFVSDLLPVTAAEKSPYTPYFGVPKGPLVSLPDWFKSEIGRFFLYVMSLISMVVSVLVTRMFLEGVIVLFRIAEDIGVLKRKHAHQQ